MSMRTWVIDPTVLGVRDGAYELGLNDGLRDHPMREHTVPHEQIKAYCRGYSRGQIRRNRRR